MNDNILHCRYDRLRRLSNRLLLKEPLLSFMQQIHYSSMKVCSLIAEDKAALKRKKVEKIYLNHGEILDVFSLIDFHLRNLQRHDVDFSKKDPIEESFECYTEVDAKKYFDDNLKEKIFTDVYGIKIRIPEKSMRLMYKDYENERHTIEPRFFQEDRGKRLSFIPFILQRSTDIFEHFDSQHNQTARLYVYSIKEINYDNNYFFVVVTHGKRKDGFNLTTAYRASENRLLKIIRNCTPVKN